MTAGRLGRTAPQAWRRFKLLLGLGRTGARPESDRGPLTVLHFKSTAAGGPEKGI